MLKSIIKLALELKIIVVIAILAVIAWGTKSYIETPRDAFPDISPVMVSIFCEAPGLAAEEVESMISQVVESSMAGLPDVNLIKSTSNFGLSVVYVYFDDDVDIYFARQIVAERLNAVQALLPETVPKPELGPISTGLGQVFIYYLEADSEKVNTEGKELLAWLRELNDFVVERQLLTVRGVTDILSMGGHVLQYQVHLNPDAMRRYNLGFNDIVEKIQLNNRNVGGQYVEIGSEEYLIRGIGRFNNLEDIGNVALRESSDIPLRLKDVAEIKYGSEVRRGVVTLNGEREVVAGLVLKLYGENTSTVIAALHKKLAEVQKSLPNGVKIVPYYDQADLVNNASKTVENALFLGIMLVIILLAIALWNLRAAIIVALAMPFCAGLAMAALNFCGLSANLMSLGGIAIALGMLVDGSIVVVENILRHLNKPANANKSRLKVILRASVEVARPIAFALLIIIAVFIPIFLFEGVEGKMFKPLAFTIVIALAGSIVAAVINAPVLSMLFLKGKVKQSQHVIATKFYIPLLKKVLAIRYFLFVIVLILLYWSGSLLLKTGREFIPTLEEGAIMVTVNMAPSISLEESEKVIKNIEKMILTHPETVGTVSRIGRPEAGSHPHPVNFAEIHVELKQPENGSIGAEARTTIVEDLRNKLHDYPGVNVNFSQPIQNLFDELLSGTRAYFALKLYGENMDILRDKADEIRHAIDDIPGVVDLAVEQSYGQPQLQIALDYHAMAHLGVTASEVMDLVENAIGGVNVGTIYQDIRRYDINVRFEENFRATPQDLGKLKIRTSTGRYVNLEQVAKLNISEGPVQINRENIQRRWTIQGNISGRAPSDIVADMRQAIAEKVTLPTGYYVEFGGQFENQERAMRKLLIVVPIVIGLIFILLLSTFKSLRNALIVIINVPLALIGGVFGLVIMGQLLSIPAAVGFIALLGIAMQDAVVLITDFQEQKRKGKSLLDTICIGSKLRFNAVILTTLTTLLGLLPLLLATGIGAEVQKPLATIVIFGLASSTLLTLFVIPAIYYEIERIFSK